MHKGTVPTSTPPGPVSAGVPVPVGGGGGGQRMTTHRVTPLHRPAARTGSDPARSIAAPPRAAAAVAAAAAPPRAAAAAPPRAAAAAPPRSAATAAAAAARRVPVTPRTSPGTGSPRGRMAAAPFLRVYLIRHGQSANNVLMDESAGAYHARRSADSPLTPLGEEQAAATGAHLRTHAATAPVPIRQLYCSAMVRAVHTASIIGAAAGLAPRVWPQVGEVGGVFEFLADTGVAAALATRGVPGLSSTALAAAFPTAILPPDASITPAGWYTGRMRETEAAAAARAHAVAVDLAAAAVRLTTAAAPGPHHATPDAALPDVRARVRAAAVLDGAAPRDAAAAGTPVTPAAAAAATPTAATSDASDTLVSEGEATGSDAGRHPGRSAKSSIGPHAVAIAVVTHGDFIDTLLRTLAVGGHRFPRAADAPPPTPPAALYYGTANCGITAFDLFGNGALRILHINDVSHLPPDRVSGCSAAVGAATV